MPEILKIWTLCALLSASFYVVMAALVASNGAAFAFGGLALVVSLASLFIISIEVD